jgi:hypothetical protein
MLLMAVIPLAPGSFCGAIKALLNESQFNAVLRVKKMVSESKRHAVVMISLLGR